MFHLVTCIYFFSYCCFAANLWRGDQYNPPRCNIDILVYGMCVPSHATAKYFN